MYCMCRELDEERRRHAKTEKFIAKHSTSTESDNEGKKAVAGLHSRTRVPLQSAAGLYSAVYLRSEVGLNVE